MQQLSPIRYLAQIQRVMDIEWRDRPLFRYTIRDHASGEVIYSGHAGDLAEATDTAQAYIDYLNDKSAVN